MFEGVPFDIIEDNIAAAPKIVGSTEKGVHVPLVGNVSALRWAQSQHELGLPDARGSDQEKRLGTQWPRTC